MCNFDVNELASTTSKQYFFYINISTNKYFLDFKQPIIVLKYPQGAENHKRV